MATTCPGTRDLLRYLTHDLSADECREVAAHVGGCAGCRHTLDSLASDPVRDSDLISDPDQATAVIHRVRDHPLTFHPPTPAAPRIPHSVGTYTILRELGRGGMGVVYLAEQAGLGRRVALKMVLAGRYASGEDLERFRAEAAAVARLSHPNIVQIYEVGEADGHPFFSLEYLDGGSLAAAFNGHPLQPRTAAELTVTLARAIDHAHAAGLIHRDLKPGNVLFANPEAGSAKEEPRSKPPTPDHRLPLSGVPKITDFGLAMRVGTDSDLTLPGSVMGTPSYMAPEQTLGTRHAIGSGVDIYALGAILYEALTGRPPFSGATGLETLDLVRTQPPVPPCRLNPKVPAALESVCLKCLRKEPARRYPTARALADDLQRFLDGKPVLARPVGPVVRSILWCRRQPALAGLIAALVLTFVGGVFGVVAKWREAEEHHKLAMVKQRQAERAERDAQRLAARVLLERGVHLCEQGKAGEGLLWLTRALETAPPGDPLVASCRALIGAWLPRIHPLRSAFLHEADLSAAVVSRDGRFAATASENGTVKVWPLDRGDLNPQPLAEVRHAAWVEAVAFAPDGGRFATASRDGTAHVWESATGQPVGPPLCHEGTVFAVRFSPDGKLLLTAGADGTARLWNAETGQPAAAPIQHPGPVRVVEFAPDGTRFVTGCLDGAARVWETTGLPVGRPMRHAAAINAVAFSPDGATLLTASEDSTARLWDAATGVPRHANAFRHKDAPICVAFSRDGTHCATGGRDKSAYVWDAATGLPRGGPILHQNEVLSVEFSPDGSLLLTASDDNTGRLTDLATGKAVGDPFRHRCGLIGATFTHEGRSVLTADQDGTALLWSVSPASPTPRLVGGPHPALTHLGLSADGRKLLGGGMVSRVYDLPEFHLAHEVQPPPNATGAAAISPDGRTLLFSGSSHEAALWDLASAGPIGSPLLHPEPSQAQTVEFSPDGQIALTGSGTYNYREPRGEASLWDARDGKLIRRFTRHSREVVSAAFSRTGNLVATGSRDRRIHVWDARTAEPIVEPVELPDFVVALAFSPDSRTLLTGCDDWIARLLEVSTGQVAVRPMPHPGPVLCVGFTPDGRFLVTGCRDGGLRFWEAATGSLAGPPLPHQGELRALAMMPGGESVATASGRIRVWPVPASYGGTPEQLLRRVRAETGLDLHADRGIVVMTQPAWRGRLQELSDHHDR